MTLVVSSVEIMLYSNRELVVFFISYKLSQRNLKMEDASERTEGDKTNGLLVTNLNGSGQLGTLSSPSGEALKAALKCAADEFELRYTQALPLFSLLWQSALVFSVSFTGQLKRVERSTSR